MKICSQVAHPLECQQQTLFFSNFLVSSFFIADVDYSPNSAACPIWYSSTPSILKLLKSLSAWKPNKRKSASIQVQNAIICECYKYNFIAYCSQEVFIALFNRQKWILVILPVGRFGDAIYSALELKSRSRKENLSKVTKTCDWLLSPKF